MHARRFRSGDWEEAAGVYGERVELCGLNSSLIVVLQNFSRDQKRDRSRLNITEYDPCFDKARRLWKAGTRVRVQRTCIRRDEKSIRIRPLDRNDESLLRKNPTRSYGDEPYDQVPKTRQI
jgi:hypothetical protein